MSNANALAARTAQWLAQLPDSEGIGGLTADIKDGLHQLNDSQLVTLAKAVAVTAQAAPDAPTRSKAAKVLQAAQQVARARETVRPTLAAKRAYPGAFATSSAGEKMTAVAARRLDKAGATNAQLGPAAPGPVRVARGDLRYYRLWEAQGRWGARNPLGGLGGLSDGPSRPGGGLDDLRPRDAIEAAMLGGHPMDAVGLQGVRGALGGLNLGKFFGNLVKDVGPIASLASAFIPGIGMAVAPILGAVTAAAGGGGGGGGQIQQYAAAPTYGPAPLPPVQAAPAKSGVPVWVWPAAAVAGVLLLAKK